MNQVIIEKICELSFIDLRLLLGKERLNYNLKNLRDVN